jgi:glycosyltransferase involved in cell wall biosynthesis
LKVLRIIARLNIGGPARHVIQLNAGLNARGHATLLAHGDVADGEASLEHVTVDRRVRSVRIPGLGPRVSPISDVRALGQLLRLTFREAPDVIHTHTAKAGTLGRLSAFVFNLTRSRHRKCLVVHTFHGHVLHGYFHPAVNLLVRWVERVLAAITHRVITISPRQRAEIVGRYSISSDSKTVTIPLGLDLVELLKVTPGTESYRGELSISPDDVVIGYVGRMVAIKDLRTLVAAFAQAVASYPRLSLLLVGDGPERATVEDCIRKCGVAERVRMLGWSEDLPRVYATMDICALSSLNEGTPVAIIEAMAAGKAVIATNVGGVPDVVTHEETGLLSGPGDVAAMAAAMVRLAASPEDRGRMGSAGRQRAATRYSIDRLVDEIESLYQSALAEVRA